jgi:hypothetical protein
VVVLVSSPAKFERHMEDMGVEVSQVHMRNDRYNAFRGISGRRLPGLDFFSSHQSNIPIGPWIKDHEFEQIVRALRAWDSTEDAQWSPERELSL